MVELTVNRAEHVVPRTRVAAIVAQQHRTWWQDTLWALPHRNIISQPRNRGTGIGILLSLLSLLERDPEAQVVFLPSDHYVQKEAVLAQAIAQAVVMIQRHPYELILLGMIPEAADPELGYIVPGRRLSNGTYQVSRFVEKPEASRAKELMAIGCLWNSFIFVADGRALLRILADKHPETVAKMREVIQREGFRSSKHAALSRLYDELPELDFSKDIVQGSESFLQVLPVPRCGWSDLGTPERVAQCLQHLRRFPLETASDPLEGRGAIFSLARAHASLRAAV